jgi:2-polyprenyl-6-methoxyphenol hydroxylase-like FAD-dependent oxidoreductase
MKRIGEHAVVIGASMGGLVAARALADFYGQVTVLERDAFPVADIPRKGRSAASAGTGAAFAQSAFHQLVYRQAAHGGAARRGAGECVP